MNQPQPTKRILAVDLGTVRCGLAVSDELEMLASPVHAIMVGDGQNLIRDILEQATILEVSKIIVGLPLNMDGTEGPRAQAGRRMAEALQAATALPVILVDERLTSFEAEERLKEAGMQPRGRIRAGRKGKRDAQVDCAAAAVLLQWYLDRPNPEALIT